MVLPPPKCGEMEAFYRVLGAMELSAEFGYTTREWGNLPLPDGPITVGIDGGYVRDWEAKKHNFEVIVGKSILAFKRDEDEDHPSSTRVGFVQTLDTKSKRRLFEVLKSQ